MRVALATSAGSDVISRDDALLAEALKEKGAIPVSATWSDPSIEWREFDLVAIRTTWDYHLRLPEFLNWVGCISEVTRVVNDPRLIEWNAHKAYLLELEDRNIPIVPTRVLADAQDANLLFAGGSLFTKAEWVIKPEVGASALGTFRTRGLSTSEVRRRILELLGRTRVLIQEYVTSIETEGELSLVWIEGRVSHAIRKLPAPGDFRIQVEHGGRNERVAIPEDAQRLAQRIIKTLLAEPTFARIDLVRRSDRWLLMELELIEPELMFEWAPESADLLAMAILVLHSQDRCRIPDSQA